MKTTPSVKAVYCFDPSTERVFVGPEVAPNILGEAFYIYRLANTWEAFHYLMRGRSTIRFYDTDNTHPWAEWLRERNDEILKQLERMQSGEASPTSRRQWARMVIRATHPDDIKEAQP